MQGAEVWKQILNGGLVTDGLTGDEPIESSIITAPIIVDTRPFDPTHTLEAGKFTVAFPFPEVWVEHPNRRVKQGALIQSDRRADGGWDVFLVAVAAPPGMRPVVTGICQLEMMPDGQVGEPFKFYHNKYRTESQEDAILLAKLPVLLVLETLSMLSCKNVALAPRPAEGRQARRAAKRYGGTPDNYRYHVLTVRPAGSKPGTPGVEFGNMPMHVCRGHFREYGPAYGKGLLFGRYEGRFFVPDHTKGNPDAGRVEKDYQVG